MNIRLKMSTVFVALALAQTSQLKTQDIFKDIAKDCKEFAQELKSHHPLEYQATKDGLAYGALGGAVKSFIPLVPKRGKGFMSCTFIGAAFAACGTVLAHRNASYLEGVKNRLEYTLQEEKEDLALKALQALKAPASNAATTNTHEQSQLLKSKKEAVKQDTTIVTEAEKAAQEAEALTQKNKAVVAKYAGFLKAAAFSIGFIFA